MKMMSCMCWIDELENTKSLLVNELGVTIFRVERKGSSIMLTVVFSVPDEETETMIKLKYPAGFFTDLSA